MMEDGSALIGEQEQVITSSFDMNIAEVLDDDTLNLISSDYVKHLKMTKHQEKTGKKHTKKD